MEITRTNHTIRPTANLAATRNARVRELFTDKTGEVLAQAESARTLKRISPQNNPFTVLVALSPQPSVIIGNQWDASYKMQQAALQDESNKDKEFITKQLRSNTRIKTLSIEFCDPAEVQNKLGEAKTPYNLVIIEPAGGKIIATEKLAKSLREIGKGSYIMHLDRSGNLGTYAYQARNPRVDEYMTINMGDLQNIDSLFDRVISKPYQRILYIGPKDAQFQRRVLRTATWPYKNDLNSDFQFDVMNDYDTAKILRNMRNAKMSGRPYTTVVIEENTWNPDGMQLAKTLKDGAGKPMLYLFPTEKSSRDSRCETIQSNTDGIRAMKFENLALRGKMPAKVSELFEGTTNSPALDEAIYNTKRRGAREGKVDAWDWSDQQALDSVHAWEPIHSLYPSRFYMALSSNPMFRSISGLLDCFCSELYAAPHVNGGTTVWSPDITTMEENIKYALDKGRFYDAVFIPYDEMDKYQETKAAIERLSPHTKLVVYVEIPRISGWDEHFKRIGWRQYQFEIKTFDQLREMTTFRAKELRDSGIPAISSNELFMTKGMMERPHIAHCEAYDGETMDSVLLRWIDYN